MKANFAEISDRFHCKPELTLHLESFQFANRKGKLSVGILQPTRRAKFIWKYKKLRVATTYKDFASIARSHYLLKIENCRNANTDTST